MTRRGDPAAPAPVVLTHACDGRGASQGPAPGQIAPDAVHRPALTPDARKPRVEGGRGACDGNGDAGRMPLDEHEEVRALLAKADRVVSHVDAEGRQWVVAAARLTPEQVEAIAQRLAAVLLRAR